MYLFLNGIDGIGTTAQTEGTVNSVSVLLCQSWKWATALTEGTVNSVSVLL